MEGDGTFELPGARRGFVTAFALLVVLLSLELSRSRPERVDPNAPDTRLVERVRDVWPDEIGYPEVDAVDALAAICRTEGADAARAIYFLLRETFADGPDGSDSWSDADSDESFEAPGWLLGEFAGASLRGELLRVLPDRERHPRFRWALVVALCRPRHAPALPALVDLALDRNEDKPFRRDVLLRLHRFGGEPPARLRVLLSQPFGAIDFLAAGTLGRWGDASGAALVRDALTRFLADPILLSHFTAAANRLAGSNLELRDSYSSGSGENGFDALLRFRRKRVTPFVESLDAALGLPAYPDPEPATLDELLDAGTDFDIAAAAMVASGYKPHDVSVELRRIERLARWLAPQVERLGDPEARITLINDLLFPREVVVDTDAARSMRASFLPEVLTHDYGNCLGYSTLYVAIGQRLGLPLHAVSSPRHSFVRYDDGQTRRNIETTEHGCRKPDEFYFGAGERLAAPNAVKSGVFLRDATARELIAQVCANFAYTNSWSGNHQGEFRAAENAIRLDPDYHNGYYHRAMGLYHTDVDAGERIEEALDRCLRIWPGNWQARVEGGFMLLKCGRLPAARRYFERALEQRDSDPATAGLALSHARAGRIERAVALLGSALEKSPDNSHLRMARLECRIRRAPDRVDEFVEGAGPGWTPRVAAARTLLALDRPRQAWSQLESVREQAGETVAQGRRRYGGLHGIDLDPVRAYLLILARAHHALGHEARAAAALARAVKLAPANHDVIVVRRLLER